MIFEDQQFSFQLASLQYFLFNMPNTDLLRGLARTQIGNYTKYYSLEEMYLLNHGLSFQSP